MENLWKVPFSITLDAYPFLLFINAEGYHLIIKYTLTSLSSKVDREYIQGGPGYVEHMIFSVRTCFKGKSRDRYVSKLSESENV